MITEETHYVACSRCNRPNPVRGDHERAYVVCHHCHEPTPGPRSRHSKRLLSHASGETCPYFCRESRQRKDRLCSHTSADALALEQRSPLPLAALLAVVFLLSGLASAGLLLALR